MAVQCAKCGEQLMGAVNRCWRCGQEFVALSRQGDLPPIRRGPVVAATTEVFVAAFSDATHTSPQLHTAANAIGNDPTTITVRRGSPFGNRGTAIMETIKPDSARNARDEVLEREVRYQKNGGATAGATLTLPLGIISFVAAFLFPLAGILLALLGLGFGVWGLNSRRRGWAVVGLLICCLSLAIATYYEVVEVYISWYGVAPWASNSSLP